MANNDEQYPGYPHYPANQDITEHQNNNGKESFDNENIPPASNLPEGPDDDLTSVSGTDADVTEEDLRALDAAEQNMDTIDSSNLIHSSLDNVDEDGDPLNEDGSLDLDMTGESLDVPGSSADNANEIIGEEDEENNYYSLGGDLHEAQEESKE